MRWSLLVVLGVGLCVCSGVAAEPLDLARFPSLLSSLHLPNPLHFCGETTPIDSQEVRERLEKELLLSLWDRPQILLWLKRSRRYLPEIERLLQDNSMPDDLKYIAIAESALLPHAGSRKGAIGFWQFTPYTARKYGLIVNNRLDERRNLVASTKAAIQYLRDLYEMFNSWTLAAAAYNMGEDGLMGEILEQRSTVYYDLYLPLETQRYVFRILTAKIVFLDPQRYGFHLDDADYYPPLRTDPVEFESPKDTPIHVVAEAAQTSFKVIKDLNPELRGHHLVEGTHRILVPQGASLRFTERFPGLLQQWLAEHQEERYVVKRGDSLSSIAAQFNIPLRALLIWNRLDTKTTIHPGDELIVHRRSLPLDSDADR